jgi:hypothetical protein
MKRILLILTMLSPALAQTSTIAPFIKCVDYDEATNTVTAYFGYVSANSSPVIIQVGPRNFVSPGPENQGQPTVFYPGAQYLAWQTSFNASNTEITWTLLGQGTTAFNDPTIYCADSILPPGPPGPTGDAGPQGPQGPAGILQPIRVVTVASTTSSATASCGSNEMVLSGGGSCSLGNGTSPLQAASASGLNWNVSCAGGQATAVALCMCVPQTQQSSTASIPH